MLLSDKVDEALKRANTKAEHLRQAILKHAFEGKLVESERSIAYSLISGREKASQPS
jgi:hypothetical protein